MDLLHVAEALAADLAGAQVDPNEAQKALAYLRAHREGATLFEYLATVVTNGHVVIRSGRTLNYYRDLQTICRRHLGPLQHDYANMVEAFAWSLRILRYYRAVPWAADEKAAERRDAQPEQRQEVTTDRQKPPAPQKVEPQLPVSGSVFTSKVLDLDNEKVVIELPGFDVQQAIGLIKAPITARPKYRVDNTARVEVLGVRTLKNGRTIVDLKPAPQVR